MEAGQIIMIALWIVFPVCIFLAWFFRNRARHKERMLMIEKGMHPDVRTGDPQMVRKIIRKIGITGIGFGTGLAIISLLLLLDLKWIINTTPVPIAILIICTAIALLIANRREAGEE